MNADFDILIIGAGPAGLSAAYTAKQCGLSYLVLERGMIAQTVYDYPAAALLHSPAEDVELHWGDLMSVGLPTREEVLNHYLAFAMKEHHLYIRTNEGAQSIERINGALTVRSSRAAYRSKRVILATGGFGIPHRLDIPGATPARVSYHFTEGHTYAGHEVLVVGGGNSAAEAALALADASARVTLSLRRPSLAPLDPHQDPITVVTPWNRARLEALAAAGQLRIVYSSHISEIAPDAAMLRVSGQENSLRVPCKRIFALLGAMPDVSLLREAGAEIAEDGRPVYDPNTHETTVSGLYVVGHLTRQLHMKNAIGLTPRIIRHIAGIKQTDKERGFLARKVAAGAKTIRAKSRVARRFLRKFPGLRKAVQSIVASPEPLPVRRET